ncbi:MAG TPA: hypothetical protein GYA06_07775 [Chloroflexi bacterium]|jgi:hypothetical protein|nr:hypothetical protein [Chloroflexota bacterium]HPO57974.1 hypothetical protein [Anaerolineaceae bacterium]
MRDRQGCLWGLLQLFLLDKLFDWLQGNVGYRRGGCAGLGCGAILMVIFLVLAVGIICNTDWFSLF